MKYIIAAICLLLGTILNAQVTIGIDKLPVKGALLDLKNDELGNNTKGLGLPRVRLTHRSHLTPMFELTSDKQNYVGAIKLEEDKKHIGLLIYNVGNYDVCDNSTFLSGTYVWEGNKWINLEGKEPPYALGATVAILKYKNQEYYTRSFGSAGRWMTQDLKAEEYDLNRTDGTIYSDLESNITLKLGTFDNASQNGTEYWITDPHELKNERIYNWQTATAGRLNSNLTITIMPGEGTKDQKKIQGICPGGWHLPSDYEFILLEKEIIANTAEYSYFKSTEVVEPTNYLATGWRGEHYGTAMRDHCFVVSGANSGGPGQSLLDRFGGFNAKMTGFHYTAGKTGQTGAFYWTSSRNIVDSNLNDNARHAMYRTIAGRIRAEDGTGVARDKKEAKHFFSIRCVKDGTNDSNNVGWKE